MSSSSSSTSTRSIKNTRSPMMNQSSSSTKSLDHTELGGRCTNRNHPYLRPKFKCSLCSHFIRSTCSLGSDCCFVAKLLKKKSPSIQEPYYHIPPYHHHHNKSSHRDVVMMMTDVDGENDFDDDSGDDGGGGDSAEMMMHMMNSVDHQHNHHHCAPPPPLFASPPKKMIVAVGARSNNYGGGGSGSSTQQQTKRMCNITSRNRLYWQGLLDSYLETCLINYATREANNSSTPGGACCGVSHAALSSTATATPYSALASREQLVRRHESFFSFALLPGMSLCHKCVTCLEEMEVVCVHQQQQQHQHLHGSSPLQKSSSSSLVMSHDDEDDLFQHHHFPNVCGLEEDEESSPHVFGSVFDDEHDDDNSNFSCEDQDNDDEQKLQDDDDDTENDDDMMSNSSDNDDENDTAVRYSSPVHPSSPVNCSACSHYSSSSCTPSPDSPTSPLFDEEHFFKSLSDMNNNDFDDNYGKDNEEDEDDEEDDHDYDEHKINHQRNGSKDNDSDSDDDDDDCGNHNHNNNDSDSDEDEEAEEDNDDDDDDDDGALDEETFIRLYKEHLQRQSSAVSLSDEDKKRVLDGEPTIDQLVSRIRRNQYKKVIIIAGAGISVSAGIPDFRTKGIGLYYTLDKYGFKLSQPEDIFDLSYFRNTDPRPYFTLSREMINNEQNPKYRPTVAHKFIKALHDQGLLLRCYTQNIDGLERMAHIPPELLVEAHGTFSSASCVDCGKKFDVSTYVSPRIMNNEIPYCDRCNPNCEASVPYRGLVKHDIVFFGEDLPDRFYEMSRLDFPAADLLIVMGTSMQVFPVAGLVHKVQPTVPRLLINMNAVGVFDKEDPSDNYRDVAMLGPCDDSCKRLMQMLGWERTSTTMASTTSTATATNGTICNNTNNN